MGEKAESEGHPPDLGLATPLFALGGVLVLLFIGRVVLRIRHRQRLNNNQRDDQMGVFAAGFRKHVLYAPLISNRHTREFRLGSIHMGNLPLRLEAVLVLGYICLNIVFAFVLVDWTTGFGGRLHQVQYAAAQMVVMNLPGLVLTAGRNNPLIPLLGIPFDTFNLIHRWIGRTVAIEAVVHVSCVVASMVHHYGTAKVAAIIRHEQFFIAALVAFIGFMSILFQAASPLRHAFYELFLHFHISLVVMAFVGLWYHIRDHQQYRILLAALGLWGLDRAARLAIVLWRNCAKRRTTATVELLAGSVARVDVAVARPWTFKAGQFMYLYIPSLGLWTSHPFSVAWASFARGDDAEKHGSSDSFNVLLGAERTTMSFLIKGRDGFTSKLLRRVEESAEGRVNVTAFAEGPFGGLHSLASYGTVLLVAGGIGITHPMSQLYELVHGLTAEAVATRKVTLVWVVKSLDHITWIQSWMTSILNDPILQARNDSAPFLSIHIYVTAYETEDYDVGKQSWVHNAPPAVPVGISKGKPSLDRIVQAEKMQQVGAMAVSVCGPGGLSDEARRVAREAQRGNVIDFYEASFSW